MVNLSIYQFRALSNLDRFPHLTELILDNNVITDEGFDLPQMPHLELLSVNKNKVTTKKCLDLCFRLCCIAGRPRGDSFAGEESMPFPAVPQSTG